LIALDVAVTDLRTGKSTFHKENWMNTKKNRN
jgi:hypothetical protein